MIHQVPNRLLFDIWPAIEPHASRAMEYHPFMTAADVLEVLKWGAAQLFVATNAGGVMGFAVMEMVQYPSRKVANVLACGGDEGFLSVAVHNLLPVLKAWGAEQGADTFALSGRPGWVRALRNAGFQSVPHVTMWADLHVEGRRIIEQPADADVRTLGGSSALSH